MMTYRTKGFVVLVIGILGLVYVAASLIAFDSLDSLLVAPGATANAVLGSLMLGES